MKEELIKLYRQYLDETREERMHDWFDEATGRKERREWKGDFDGFMRWLSKV